MGTRVADITVEQVVQLAVQFVVGWGIGTIIVAGLVFLAVKKRWF